MREGRDKRSGVAVIIVLGLLALLMVLGVAFSTTMRVERFGAGNYARDVRTKQVIWMGLSRAIAALDRDIGSSMYPNWQNDMYVSGTGGVINLAYGEALDYVPGVLHDYAARTQSEWLKIEDAWYAYQVINCSHMLDANFAGGDPEREGGLSPTEIQIEAFPSVVDLGDFREYRKANVRYESLPELEALNTGIVEHDYFSTYSRYPIGILLNGGMPGASIAPDLPVSLHGDEGELSTRKAEIEAALDRMLSADHGVPRIDGDAAFVYQNLLDYIDEDCVPRDLNLACTERVPMVNEIQMYRARLTRTTADSCEVRAQIIVENAYPFMTRIEHTFSTEGAIELTMTADGEAEQSSIVPFTVDSGYQQIGTAPYFNAEPISAIWTFPNASATNSFVFGARLLGVTNIVNEASGSYPAGSAVDAVAIVEGSAAFAIVTGAVVDVGVNVTMVNAGSMETRDPRYNWTAGDNTMWRQPLAGDNTLGAQNSWAAGYFARRANGTRPYVEKSSEMHVSDRGHLVAVGELGNLLRSAQPRYWESIRLFDPDRDHVLRHFTMAEGSVQRGLVNLNNKVDEVVMDAAITNLPAMFDESEDGTDIAPEDVVTIRNMIMDWREASTNNVFYNVDDLADRNWRAAGTFNTRSDLELESMLAYLAGVLGTRQNLFTIIVAEGIDAGGVGRSLGTEMLIGRRAVAQVWRDPFPDEEDMNPCFVRYFKWLDN